MLRKILVLSFLIFNSASIEAYELCNDGDLSSTDYIRRDDNRCEGIKDNSPISGRILELISFTTRKIDRLEDNLKLEVPRINNNKPGVFVQTTEDNYLLDGFSLSSDQSSYFFTWSSYVLKEAKISLNKLRSLSAFKDDYNRIVHLPVILGQPSGKYEFVIFAPFPTRISTFEISLNGQVVHSDSRTTRQREEIIFTWDGRNEPAGRYKLYFVGEVEQFNAPSEEIPVEITFEHNPNWLK